jgi:Rha family phage regulatory protein
MQPSVFVTEKGNPATDSRRVAEKFGKRHSDVLRAVREIVKHLTEDEAQRKIASGSIFHPHHYLDGNGQQRDLFVMNRAAFTLLVLGFTGKKATLFKDQYVAEFDRMEGELRRMTLGQPSPRKLTDFAQPTVQIECVKEVAAALYKPNNDPGAIIDHHRRVSVLLTGLRPSDYVREFVKKGLRVASLSARQLMRRLEPAKACTAAFLDDARVRGKSLAQLESAGVVEALPQAFDALLRAGYSLDELGA